MLTWLSALTLYVFIIKAYVRKHFSVRLRIPVAGTPGPDPAALSVTQSELRSAWLCLSFRHLLSRDGAGLLLIFSQSEVNKLFTEIFSRLRRRRRRRQAPSPRQRSAGRGGASGRRPQLLLADRPIAGRRLEETIADRTLIGKDGVRYWRSMLWRCGGRGHCFRSPRRMARPPPNQSPTLDRTLRWRIDAIGGFGSRCCSSRAAGAAQPSFRAVPAHKAALDAINKYRRAQLSHGFRAFLHALFALFGSAAKASRLQKPTPHGTGPSETGPGEFGLRPSRGPLSTQLVPNAPTLKQNPGNFEVQCSYIIPRQYFTSHQT